MSKLNTRDWNAITEAIKANKPFKTNGSLYGENGPTFHNGRLPSEYSARKADYVIYSYATPIAWRENGEWTIPDTKYSVTTTKQQSTVRMAISRL